MVIAQLTMESAKAWVLVIGAVTSPLVIITMGIIQLRQGKRMEHKVDRTVANTNHALGESLRIGMISAQLLARDGNPLHVQMAQRAELDYQNHQRQMNDAEKLPFTSPLQ